MTGLRGSGLAGSLGFIGGLLMLGGGGLLFTGATSGGALLLVLGLILFWWGLADRRKDRPENPESEHEGEHTIE